MYRTKNWILPPLEKLRSAVKRIVRIVNSYQSTAFADLMDEIRQKISDEKNARNVRRQSRGIQNLTPAERNEKVLIMVIEKLERIESKLDNQEQLIKFMNDETSEKIQKLR